MADSSENRDRLELLAEEFVARLRAGQRPSLTEYINRLPDRAEEVRELFPALVELEQLKPPDVEPKGNDGPRIGPADPERIGEYRILRRLGVGGMGVVYEAIQESLGRHVALKLLPHDVAAHRTRLERFRREARSAAGLHHTNIVPVFGIGHADGRHFYAMQFIAGHPLDVVIDEVRRQRDLSGRLPSAPDALTTVATALMTGTDARPAGPATQDSRELVSDPSSPVPAERLPRPSLSRSLSDDGRAYWVGVARVGAQVADALAYAHAQGVLHRDIKPANLLLDLKGTVWVADFGLAKAKESADLTRDGEIVGTLRYMAPERFDGAGDHRADIYALGLTLYEMLALRPAFNAEQGSRLIEQVRLARPPTPHSINPAVPLDLETVVLKAIACDPAERYQDAGELAEDLQRFIEDRPVLARRATQTEHMWRWCRRNPAVASLVTAIVLVSLLGAVAASVLALRAAASARQAEANARASAAAETEGRRKLFDAYLSEAKANRMSRRPGQRFQTLKRVRQAVILGRELKVPQERFDELRQIAVTALAMPDIVPRYLGEVPGNLEISDLSNDVSQAIFRESATRQHVIRAVNGGAEICRLPAADHATEAFFSPDRRCIVRHGSGRGPVEVWSIEPTGARLILQGDLAILGHHFRPDGRVLALALQDGGIVVWDLRTGTEIRRFPSPGVHQGMFVALHPTEPLFACGSNVSTRMWLHDYQTGQMVQAIDTPWVEGSSSLAWHPDGKRLFVASDVTGEVQEYRFDRAAGTLSPGRMLQIAALGGNRIFTNVRGDRIASTGWTSAAALFDLETESTLFISAQIRAVHQLRFSSDGRSLVGIWGLPRGRPSYGVLDAADAREVRTIPLGSPGGDRPAIHPGGLLAVISQGDKLTFVDLAGMREVAVVRRAASGPVSLAFDDEGTLYSNSFDGAFRWPVRLAGDRGTVGYPDRLPFQPGSKPICASADGQVIAQAQFEGYGFLDSAGGWLITPDRRDDPRYLKRPGTGMDSAAVSRDGHWVCLGVHEGHALVYDSRTGALVWEDTRGILGNLAGAAARFTADGRWLVGNWAACHVGDWDNHVVLDASRRCSVQDVSPDARTAILSTTEGYCRLVEIATGRELVRIEAPEGGLGPVAFSADGTRLLEPSAGGLRVWHLPRIRVRLTELGLDWDAPAYRAEPQDAPGVPAPLQLTILGGNLLSDPAQLAAHDRGATAVRLLINPLDARGHLETAQRLIAASDFARALPHLRVAALTRPESYLIRMNAGLCLMKRNRAQEAILEFHAAATAQPDDDRPRRWLACAYLQVGRSAEAARELTALLAWFPREADLYEQRAACHAALGDQARAAADRAAADSLLPRSAVGLGNRADELLNGPPGSRDPKQALELIRKAVQLEPDQTVYLNALGVALYRNDRFTEAIAALEKSLVVSKGRADAFDLFFLAMCHARLGETATARAEFDRAVAWVNQKKNLHGVYLATLARFRAEAEKELSGKWHGTVPMQGSN